MAAATMTVNRPPAITLTDPNNHDAAPSPALSPTTPATHEQYFSSDLLARVAAARPSTPKRNSFGGNNGRPESASGWVSPGRLLRTLSSGGAGQNTMANTLKDGGAVQEQPQTIDPLSQHILKRTNAPLMSATSMSSRSRPTENYTLSNSSSHNASANHYHDDKPSKADRAPAPAVQEPSSNRAEVNEHAVRELKKGIKAVSFLNRLMGGAAAAKKKEADVASLDEESSSGDNRPEGNHAEVFAQSTDNMGFQPQHPQPPAYIKVRSKYKRERDFDRLFLAQELHGTSRPSLQRQDTSSSRLRRKTSAQGANDARTVWAMEFSRNGKYFAAAGADMVLRVWAVLSSLDERHQLERQESNEHQAQSSNANRTAEHLSAPVFQSRPVREYEGHTATILDLSWSKNNFLLSSSMDKTVRLWHVSRAECLCTFKHNDFVPSISFHPKDDRFFLAGSLDSKLRLWSIPDKSVAFVAQVPDMITAVAFTPDGKYAIAGTLTGLCLFYETEGLKYQTQIHVRSTRGSNAKGSKITGIRSHYAPTGDVKVLITSNDSRIRLYNFRDKSLELKFRGNENNVSQIRAAVSDDAKFVVCGSEDRMAYIWSLDSPQGDRRDKTPVEMFEAHDTIATCVCIAPTKTRQYLARSEDPVYDVCNPPPITLLSQAERDGSRGGSNPPTENGSIQNTPVDPEAKFERVKESPAYLARSTHRAGHIIVTADYAGKIKVFRQDCAWSKRPQDDWDKSSIFTKRSGKISRTASLATRSSQRSLTEKRNSMAMTPTPTDHINSWRQGVATYPGVGGGAKKPHSVSPRHSVDRPTARTNAGEGADPSSIKSADTRNIAADTIVGSPEPLERNPMEDAAEPTNDSVPHTEAPNADGRQGRQQSSDNPLNIIGGQSYAFWDMNAARRDAAVFRRKRHDPQRAGLSSEDMRLDAGGAGDAEAGEGSSSHLPIQRPPLQTTQTAVSQLSDEHSSIDDRYDDAPEDSSDGEERIEHMQCLHCPGTTFAARDQKDGSARLICLECGIPAPSNAHE